MSNFVTYRYRRNKDGSVTVYPDFHLTTRGTSDIMSRGGAFYAYWDEEKGLWNKDERDGIFAVDNGLWQFVEKLKEKFGTDTYYDVKTVSDFASGKLVEWKKFFKSNPDIFVDLDSKVTFKDQEVKKKDYVSKRLPYVLSDGDTPNYDLLMSTLYSEEERDKLEWAIGSIFTGDAAKIQKFIVLYGEGGTGKSTILNIIQMLFEGYYITFDAKSLASSSNQFSLEQFRSNPLVAIQHDGNLSRIEDNSKLNSLIAHEPLVINEKFKTQYETRFSAFLFMGTNKPVQITDAKSGIIRRLIDVRPTGKTLPFKTYTKAMNGVKFELGAIARHCIEKYEEMGIDYYNSYRPMDMFSATNDMYNFVLDHYEDFANAEYVTLKRAWKMYDEYVTETKMQYPLSMRPFKAELKNYFEYYYERKRFGNGVRENKVYCGFKTEKFSGWFPDEDDEEKSDDAEDVTAVQHEDLGDDWLIFNCDKSRLDEVLADCPAQYAKDDGTPMTAWSKVKTKLRDIDTSKEHYVKPPGNMVVADFDIKGDDGNKSVEKNLEAAKEFPVTYGEFSKSGAGIHLHYFYDGNVDDLSRIFGDNVEIKTFKGNAALRRRVSKCNDIYVATISSGLPLKGEKKVLNVDDIKDEKHLRARIKNCIAKKHHGHTTPEVNYIYDSLEAAYKKGFKYDVTDLKKAIMTFCMHSTNQKQYCLKLFTKMRFQSKDYEYGDEEGWDFEEIKSESAREACSHRVSGLPLIIFDIEVFPNVLLVCFKEYGEGKECIRWFNPSPAQIEWLIGQRLVGYNNRAYDNHILYARFIGKSIPECYGISKDIIANVFNGFGPAFRISEMDVYDIASKKQSLKKWEIELAAKGKLVHHQELGFRWDEPVPEDKWDIVAEYCCNDVLATEAVLNEIHEDIKAREILSKLSGLSVNERSRAHAAQIIFGSEKHPKLVYTDLATGKRTDGTSDIVSFPGYEYSASGIDRERYGDNKVITGKSIYKGQDPGEGGFVYAEPGIYYDVALLDIASMHPTSMDCLNIFGDYTQRFRDIKEGRLSIKHRDFDKLEGLLDGVFMDYIGTDDEMDTLAKALKLVINSVYGFTTATFENPFKDPRNVDNIVAKRGALFMIDLKEEVQKRGFTVAHIKTDSIKIPNATPEIIDFVIEFGKKYGYSFEHEATYERMCLVNDAVYIAKYKDGKHAGEWTATGKQFQVPYVFKSLFSHEEITLEDLCETKSVSTAMYLDMNEGLGEDEHNYIFVGRVGQFCPMGEGAGGGVLVREKKDRSGYDAVNGTKGYRWLESEIVRSQGLEDKVDRSYYNKLCDDAVDTIEKFGIFEQFVDGSLEMYVNAVPFMNAPEVEIHEVSSDYISNPKATIKITNKENKDG